MLANQEPTFNLKVVVRETGLKPDTLRAWERRYGLPQPERTEGGHRLYSQQDIDTIRWLVARQREGMSISRAVELWHQIEAQGQNPLDTAGQAVSHAIVRADAGTDRTIIDEFQQAWLLACLAFDELKADRVLNEAFSLYTPEIVCLELILPALAEIGRGWYEGEITVHQEHFASALAMRRLETLLVATPNPTKSGRLIIGCPSGEEHVLSMLLLTLLLRRRGWEVVYLGANIPVFRLAATIAATNPQLVILSAHLLPSVVYLQEIGQLLQKLKVPLAFGGQIFNLRPSLPTRIPGHFLGKRLDEAVARIEGLLTTPPPLPQPEKLSSTYQQALEGYRRYLAQIESDVWQALYDPENLYYQQLSLTLTDQNLARHITAALSLGDMAFIGDNLTWLNSLLNNQNLPIDLLQHYLAVYHHVIQTHLGQTGQPISDWFEQILANQPQHEV